MMIREHDRQYVGAAAATAGMMHVTCLNCGKEFPYDWQQMKIIIAPRQSGESPSQRHHALALKALKKSRATQ
jgi:hypothetical protein